MTNLFRLLVAACLVLGGPAWAAGPESYLTAAQVDLLRLLPPPPAADSAQTAAEMAEIVATEASRTPARAALATADHEETVFAMFTRTLGPLFSAERLPLTAAMFDRIGETEEVVVGPAKSGFARLRPYLANTALRPIVPQSKSGAYPSGHATRGRLEGTVLAAMLPEHRAALFARIDEYAESRLIAGVHYRTDLVAGQQAGAATAAVLMNDPAFKADFAAARQELRRVMHLP